MLIEDDTAVAKDIQLVLGMERFVTEHAGNGEVGLDKLSLCNYDAVILDLNLPGKQGLAILQEFRNRGGTTPVLILTGKSELTDKELGLNTGADDYLTKPFHMRELIARLRALLRRPANILEKISVRHLTIDLGSQEVFKNGERLYLRPIEYAVLAFLARHSNRLFTSEALIERVWHSESQATVRSLQTCMARLRAKIDLPDQPSIIETVYGTGYRLTTDRRAL